MLLNVRNIKKVTGDVGGLFCCKTIQNDIDALMQLPPAQLERKKSKWIATTSLQEVQQMNREFTKEAVLALIEEEMNHYDEYEDAKEFNVLYDIYEAVKGMKDNSKELPRWIFHRSGDEDSLVERLMSPGDYYSCPVCFNTSNVPYNYCPSCGEKLGTANYRGENK